MSHLGYAKCSGCGSRFIVDLPVDASPPLTCPQCGKAAAYLLGPSAEVIRLPVRPRP